MAASGHEPSFGEGPSQPPSATGRHRPFAPLGGCRSLRIGIALHNAIRDQGRSEEHTSELQSRVDISYAVFCLKKKNGVIIMDSASVAHLRTFKQLTGRTL